MESWYILILFYIPIAGLIMLAKRRQVIKLERVIKKYYELQVARARRRFR